MSTLGPGAKKPGLHPGQEGHQGENPHGGLSFSTDTTTMKDRSVSMLYTVKYPEKIRPVLRFNTTQRRIQATVRSFPLPLLVL